MAITPLDLARRTTTFSSRVPALPAPTPLTREDGPFLPLYVRGITRSRRLTPYSRLLALTLATYADWDTGYITDARQPGLAALEHATGLNTIQIRAALRQLRSTGWLIRTGPTEPAPSAIWRTTLLIPPKVLAAVRRS